MLPVRTYPIFSSGVKKAGAAGSIRHGGFFLPRYGIPEVGSVWYPPSSTRRRLSIPGIHKTSSPQQLILFNLHSDTFRDCFSVTFTGPIVLITCQAIALYDRRQCFPQFPSASLD